MLLKGVAHFDHIEALTRVEIFAPEEVRTQRLGGVHDHGVPEGDLVPLSQYRRGQDVEGIGPVIVALAQAQDDRLRLLRGEGER